MRRELSPGLGELPRLSGPLRPPVIGSRPAEPVRGGVFGSGSVAAGLGRDWGSAAAPAAGPGSVAAPPGSGSGPKMGGETAEAQAWPSHQRSALASSGSRYQPGTVGICLPPFPAPLRSDDGLAAR